MTCHSHLSFMIFQIKKAFAPCFKQKDESLNFRVTTLIYRYSRNNSLFQYLGLSFSFRILSRCNGHPVVSLLTLAYSALRPSSISFSLPIFSKQGSLQTSVTCTLLFKAFSFHIGLLMIIATGRISVNIFFQVIF